MAANFLTTFSNAFSWMKIQKFGLRFHWSLFPKVQLTIFHHWFRKWLGAWSAPIHYLNQWWLYHWHIYASLGLNGLSNVISLQNLSKTALILTIWSPPGAVVCKSSLASWCWSVAVWWHPARRRASESHRRDWWLLTASPRGQPETEASWRKTLPGYSWKQSNMELTHWTLGEVIIILWICVTNYIHEHILWKYSQVYATECLW